MAGSSIEAGAKIYASRVDALHIQAYQVLDQVSQLDKDGVYGPGSFIGLPLVSCACTWLKFIN